MALFVRESERLSRDGTLELYYKGVNAGIRNALNLNIPWLNILSVADRSVVTDEGEDRYLAIGLQLPRSSRPEALVMRIDDNNTWGLGDERAHLGLVALGRPGGVETYQIDAGDTVGTAPWTQEAWVVLHPEVASVENIALPSAPRLRVA